MFFHLLDIVGFDTAALVEYRKAEYRDPPPTQPTVNSSLQPDRHRPIVVDLDQHVRTKLTGLGWDAMSA